jgi:hypothetical protein
MANLYDIDDRILTLMNEGFDIEDGTIYDNQEELARAIDNVAMELDSKIENIGCYIKNLESDIEAYKREEDKLHTKRKSAENRIESLKRYLDGYLTSVYPNDEYKSKWKLKTARCAMGYRKSQTVNVPDIEKLDKKYIKVKTEVSADKLNIAKALKTGQKVEGASLQTNYNLSIR